jgi:hypothetical protein
MTSANEVLLCSACFDHLTEIPPPADAATVQDDDVEDRRRA